jgi:hypothetical protein
MGDSNFDTVSAECYMRGAVIAVLTTAPISGTSIKPEAQRRVYWTNVSTNTKVGIGNMGN